MAKFLAKIMRVCSGLIIQTYCILGRRLLLLLLAGFLSAFCPMGGGGGGGWGEGAFHDRHFNCRQLSGLNKLNLDILT